MCPIISCSKLTWGLKFSLISGPLVSLYEDEKDIDAEEDDDDDEEEEDGEDDEDDEEDDEVESELFVKQVRCFDCNEGNYTRRNLLSMSILISNQERTFRGELF